MKIEELRKLSKGATSGPWTSTDNSTLSDLWYQWRDKVKNKYVLEVLAEDLPSSDGKLIAAMRNHFEVLLDVAEAAKKSRMCVTNCASYFFSRCDCGHVDIKRALKKLEQG